MSQELRTPETYYVGYGFIKFRKTNGMIHYYLCKSPLKEPLAEMFEGVGNGIIRDENHIQQFLNCKTIEQMLEIHNKESVSH